MLSGVINPPFLQDWLLSDTCYSNGRENKIWNLLELEDVLKKYIRSF